MSLRKVIPAANSFASGILIFIIFLIGMFLRFYDLGNSPNGFHRDEAFLGYNAYSIYKTGKDINGHFLPLHLESFLYTPSGYSYFSVPFIALFDLNKFSVRFASALFGSLTTLLTYFLVKKLFKDFGSSLKIVPPQRDPVLSGKNLKFGIPEVATLLLAISPWHINLSRTASVSSLVVFFITAGILIYLYWLKNNKIQLLLVSFILFSISLSFYIAPYSFLPVFIPFMVLVLNPKLNLKKIFPTIFLFFVLILIPVFLTFFSKDLSLRANSLSFTNNSVVQLVLDEKIREDGTVLTSNIITRIFHNKPIGYANQFLTNYFHHFSYDFLFSDQGFPERYKVPLVGLLYIFEIPLILLGIWWLLNYQKRIALFLLGWIALVPVGSSLATDDVPNLQRTLFIFPAISIISASGLIYLFSLMKNQKLFKISYFLISIIIVSSVIFYLHEYYVHANIYRPWNRQDGYETLISKVNSLLPKYNQAIITNRESAPTIFFLFFSKYEPQRFQSDTKNSQMTDFDRVAFGKYIFSEEECPLKDLTSLNSKTLYVNSFLCKIPSSAKTLDIIKRSDDSKVFQVLSNE